MTTMTVEDLADAFECFGNTAISAMHSGTADVCAIAQGIDAVAWPLREIGRDKQTSTDDEAYLSAIREIARLKDEISHLAKGVKVPDAIAGPGVVMSRQDAYDASYADGWNACRQAMLSQRGEVSHD